MERKLIVLGAMCFVALCGLSIGGVSCSPVSSGGGKNAMASVGVRNKTNLDLKVEAVYHDGKIKKYMSYLNYNSSESNGNLRIQVIQKRLDQKDPRVANYSFWLGKIPRPSFTPSVILAGGNKTVCPRKDDIRFKRGNLSLVWAPQRKEESYKGLLSQCDLLKPSPVLGTQGQGKPWYLDTCNPSVNSPRSSVAKAVIPLYTIYVSTTDQIMIFNPLASFNVNNFVLSFPFELMEIKNVVTLCSAGYKELENLKTGMRMRLNSTFVVQEVLKSGAIVFVKVPKGSGQVPVKVTATTTLKPSSAKGQVPKMVTLIPMPSVKVPELLTLKPNASVQVPKVVTLKPNESVQIPTVVTLKPNASVQVPEVVTLNPKETVQLLYLEDLYKLMKNLTASTTTTTTDAPRNATLNTTLTTTTTTMRSKGEVVEKDVRSDVYINIHVGKGKEVTKMRSVGVLRVKPGDNLAFLIAIVGLGMGLQLGLLFG